MMVFLVPTRVLLYISKLCKSSPCIRKAPGARLTNQKIMSQCLIETLLSSVDELYSIGLFGKLSLEKLSPKLIHFCEGSGIVLACLES